jgi:predicted RNase H-like HicB family nuclease
LKFTVDVRKDPDDGFVHVECRELQGCHTFTETEEAVLDKITDVILDHLHARVRNDLKRGIEGDHPSAPDGHSHVVEIHT